MIGVRKLSNRLEVIGVPGIPNVNYGDHLASMIQAAASGNGIDIQENDIIVVTQKIVSKSEGATVDLNTVIPSPFAMQIAGKYDKDPRHVEVVLNESVRIVRMGHGVIISETRHGFICANAGVDASNISNADILCLLPKDPDESARRIRTDLIKQLGFNVSVIITDTFGRPWRHGTTDVAIGASGIEPLKDYRGLADPYGYPIRVSISAVVDEIASAAELVAGKVDMIPVVIVRGYEYKISESSSTSQLIREPESDLFR